MWSKKWGSKIAILSGTHEHARMFGRQRRMFLPQWYVSSSESHWSRIGSSTPFIVGKSWRSRCWSVCCYEKWSCSHQNFGIHIWWFCRSHTRQEGKAVFLGAKRLDIVSDTYQNLSIKDTTREARGIGSINAILTICQNSVNKTKLIEIIQKHEWTLFSGNGPERWRFRLGSGYGLAVRV